MQHMLGPADSLPTFPSSRLQPFFLLSKKAEYFLGAPSGWVLVKPGVRGQCAAEGRVKALIMCVWKILVQIWKTERDEADSEELVSIQT